MDEFIVRSEDFSFRYPKQEAFALRELNLEVRRGEFLAVMGPTGAGKSTLCLALNGIVPHFFGGEVYGSLSVGGMDTTEHATHELAQTVRIIFEDPEMQLTAPSVLAEVAFTLENLRFPAAEIRRRVDDALRAVRLDGLQDKHPHQLSGGQKQRLAIASAIALSPAVLVLDEPTSQLDPVGTEEVFELVAGLNEQGVTVILVTHVTEAVADHADRVAVLVDGRTWALGTPQEIFQDTDALREVGIRPPEVTEALQRLFPVPTIEAGTFPIRLDDAIGTFRSLRPAAPALNGARGDAPSGADTAPDSEAGIQPDRAPVLSCRNLVHTYPDGTRALRGLDLDIHEGDYVAIVGQNGAGKSTLVRHFLHLLKRTSGSVQIQGQDVDDFEVSDLAHRIGYVSQNPDNQIFTDSVEDEVAFALRNLRTPADEIDQTVGRVLEEMRLGWARDRHPVTLSKGDRARVVIAAVLAMDPSILIFDEPTIGQDFLGAKAILDLTRELHQGGRTVVLITHHLYLLPGYAHRLIVMGKGSVLMDGPLRDGYYAAETLQETFLRAPQLVRFAQSVTGSERIGNRPLTVDELAETLTAP